MSQSNTSTSKTVRTSLAALLSGGAAVLALTLAPGCGDDPCQAYVDYVCDCDEASCDSTRNTYEGADAKLQDECETALEDEQAADDDAGTECANYGGADTGA